MADITNGTPDQAGTIRGLAQAPLHLQNMVAELVDNALAATAPEIYIDLSQHPDGGDLFVLRIWDHGPGISLDDLRDKVFRLGQPPGGTSHLNEHGFGLKNVLAKAEQLSGKEWFFRTRDAEALARNQFYSCTRPFSFSMPIATEESAEWPAFASPGTGTVCEIQVPMSYMQTVAFGRGGARPRDLGLIMEYLREHLGVTYRGYLEGGARAAAKILTSTAMGEKTHVDVVSPDYSSKKSVGFDITVNGTRQRINGTIGLVDKNSVATKSRHLYYKHSPESQGVDVRVGKRVVATRMISEIWERDRHPSLNGVAGEFVVPASRGTAPPTLNNKTSLDFDSPIWTAIVEGVQEVIPVQELPAGGGKSEDDLRNELLQQIKGLSRPSDVVEKEFSCAHGICVDIIWDQTATGGPIYIYEVKKGKAAPINLYQLLMYWDGLVSIGKKPTCGYLVSSDRSTGVSTLLDVLKDRKDNNGNKYDLILDGWANHGITP